MSADSEVVVFSPVTVKMVKRATRQLGSVNTAVRSTLTRGQEMHRSVDLAVRYVCNYYSLSSYTVNGFHYSAQPIAY